MRGPYSGTIRRSDDLFTEISGNYVIILQNAVLNQGNRTEYSLRQQTHYPLGRMLAKSYGSEATLGIETFLSNENHITIQESLFRNSPFNSFVALGCLGCKSVLEVEPFFLSGIVGCAF